MMEDKISSREWKQGVVFSGRVRIDTPAAGDGAFRVLLGVDTEAVAVQQSDVPDLIAALQRAQELADSHKPPTTRVEA
jgi:hypothetical protein